MDGEAVLSALCGGVKPSLSLVAASLSALGLIPFEAITLSPGQAHHRIAPVTSTTPPPPPLQQRGTPTKTAKC